MKKLLLLLLVIGGAAALLYLAREGKVQLPAALGGADRAVLKTKSERFLECLKFKNFQEAASFHSAADLKATPNIPKLLEDFFLIPPESLDVQEYRVDYVELDSTRQRAKVKTVTTVHILNKKETQKPEIMLYWKREGEQWFMDLRTTLERRRGL
ncbi:MAG: hypothetical protein HY553_15690 [Elusimicrobia bacterium]|nr:hypothetical protein [Elusimicrobiota bacterium]